MRIFQKYQQTNPLKENRKFGYRANLFHLTSDGGAVDVAFSVKSVFEILGIFRSTKWR